MEERKAWMLFLSSDNYYLYMLLGVYKNLLDTNTKYPIYCGITEDVSKQTEELLNKIGLKTIKLSKINFNISKLKTSMLRAPKHYQQAFTKLLLLGTDIESKFDKIVYLDTDLQIFENIDELMDMPHMSAVRDKAPGAICGTRYVTGCSIFCSGLFVWDFKSNPGKGQWIIDNLNELDPKVTWHDQNVLNYFYSDWITKQGLHLDPGYGLMNFKRNFDAYNAFPKIIHYTGRLKTDWPFDTKITLTEKSWAYGNLHFKEWIENLANTVEYFNLKFNLNIPKLHPENLIIQAPYNPVLNAYGRPGTYLYF